MSGTPHLNAPEPEPVAGEQSLRRRAELLHRETELAWLHSNDLPVQLLLIPAVGEPVGLCVDLRQPRTLGEAVIRQAAVGINAEAIIACLHVDDLYLDGEPHGVFGHTDDHGTRLLPPRDAAPGPASPTTAPLNLPLASWLAGMLPGPPSAHRSPP